MCSFYGCCSLILDVLTGGLQYISLMTFKCLIKNGVQITFYIYIYNMFVLYNFIEVLMYIKIL